MSRAVRIGARLANLIHKRTYCVAEESIAFKIPPSISHASASTVPLASNTAFLALFSKDCLNMPRENSSGTSLLVWGCSCKYLKFLNPICSNKKQSDRRIIHNPDCSHVWLQICHHLQPWQLRCCQKEWRQACLRLQ